MSNQKITLNVQAEVYKQFQTVMIHKGYSASKFVNACFQKAIAEFEFEYVNEDKQIQQSIKLAKALQSSGIETEKILTSFKEIHNNIGLKIIEIHLNEVK